MTGAVIWPLILAALAQPMVAQASTLSDLAECRLDWPVAKTAVAGLQAIGSRDYSDDYADDVTTYYNPSSVAPFGFSIATFEKHYLDDGYGVSNLLTFELERKGSYLDLRAKVLVMLGRRACASETGEIGRRDCEAITRAQPADLPDVRVYEFGTTTYIQCYYKLN